MSLSRFASLVRRARFAAGQRRDSPPDHMLTVTTAPTVYQVRKLDQMHLDRGMPAIQTTIVRVFALGLAVVALALAGCKEGKPENAYQEGVAAYVAYNDAEAERLFTLAAGHGDAAAQTILGMMYSSGKVPRDLVDGKRWLKLAADQGDAEAQFLIVLLEMNQNSVPKTEAETKRLFFETVGKLRLAADQGNAFAELFLAQLFLETWNASDEESDSIDYRQVINATMPKGHAEALRLVRRAADKGDARSQLTLANIYRFGRGVPENEAEAARWFGLAARQGDAKAQETLGSMHWLGDGVPENPVEAAYWFKLAADQGETGAQIALAGMYERGEGVPETYVEAYKWYNILTASSDVAQLYRDAKEALRSKMTPDQIAEAQRLSSVWKPRTRKLARFLRGAIPPIPLSP